MIKKIQIASDMISVVIQGPLKHGNKIETSAKEAIASIRKYLPNAEIVVSTWYGEVVDDLVADNIIFSHDPGPLKSKLGLVNNVNRQLVSTLAGIEASTKPYDLKFRADMLLAGSAITEILQVSDSNSRYSIFKNCITTSNLYVTNHYQYPQLFHASDVVQFGTKADLLDFWQQPLFTHADAFLDFTEIQSYFEKVVFHGGIKLVPEQLLTLGWLRKHGYHFDVPRRHYGNLELLGAWEEILVNNFHIVDYSNSGVVFPPRFTRDQYMARFIFKAADILGLRTRIIGGSHRPNFRAYRIARLRVLITVAPSHLADVAAAALKDRFPIIHAVLRPLWHPVRKLLKL